MAMTIGACPVCGRLNAESQFLMNSVNPYESETYYRCPRCFEFVIENRLKDLPRDPADTELIPYLSSYLRRNQSSVQPELTRANWKELALAEKRVTVPQKLERLLQLIAGRTAVPGKTVYVDPDIDAPLFNALNTDEVNYLLASLQERQFVDLGGTNAVLMKVKGWEQVIPQPGSGGIPGRCFVAMWFAPEMDEVFNDAISPAAEDCSFKATRIDREQHNGDINDAILAEVKKSQFVIADFTGHRAGVYFEAGFARGLGREVIWCCREDEFDKSHFDTNHYSHVVWKDIADLKKQLTARIMATIPNAKSSA